MENRAAYPHQELQGVPPGAELFRDDCMPLTGKHFSGVGIIDPSHISRYNQLRQQIVGNPVPGEKLCRKAEVVDAKKPLEEVNIAEGGFRFQMEVFWKE